MANNSSGLPNSWLQKVMNFYIKTAGLEDDNLLSKYILKFHYAMSIPILLTACQEFIGIFVKLKQDQFTLQEIVMQLVYGVIMCLVLAGTYTLTCKKHILAKCIHGLTLKLRCISHVDEALIWQKHLPIINFLVLSFTISCCMILVLMTVFQPLIRFTFHREKLSYLVFPNWYPVNVALFSEWFWVAVVYEFVVIWYGFHTALGTCIIFLYAEVATNVRFDALTPYFQEILLCSHRVSNDSRRLKTAFLSKNANVSRAISEVATITSAGRSENLNREKLIRGIEDWNILRRQTKLINNTFAEYISWCHFAASVTNVIMAFATTIELQHFFDEPMEVITGCSLYLSLVFASTIFLYIVSYYVTLLQQSNDKLRNSLWESSWVTQKTEWRELLFYYNTALNQPMIMKIYSFYPINLHSFTKDMSRLRAYFLFLYQLSAAKNK